MCVFLLYLLQRIFSKNLGQDLFMRKMVLKKFSILFLFIKQILFIRLNLLFHFFSLIYLFFYLFCHMPNPKILWSVVQNQKMRWKNNEQQIVGTQTFPHLNSLTFNYMWFNFQVFISYASSYWSFYYSHFCCLLPPTPLTTEKLEQRCEICSN